MKTSLTFNAVATAAAAAAATTAGTTAAFQSPSAFNAAGRYRYPSTNLFLSAAPVAVVDVDEGAYRDIAAMEEWAAACGVQRADGFQLAAAMDEKRGSDYDNSSGHLDAEVMTSQDLPADSPILFVPNEMILSSEKAVQEFGRLEAAESRLESLNAADELKHFYLMVKILVEYEKGDASPWFPWLNSLPRYYSNGASMTDFCYECLPPLVSSLATQERTNLMNLEMSLRNVPFLSEQTKGDVDLRRWAFQVVYTRSFANDGSDDLRIVPMADMFNHGANPEIETAYDEEGNLHAWTTQDVSAGSSLRVTYGDPTNPSFLLARYGFLDESSAATFCKIMIPHVNRQLEDMGYAHNRMLFYKDTGDVSQEVWDVLLYQILSASNAARRREFYNAHMAGDGETKEAFHNHFYPETSEKLKDHLDTVLEQLDRLSEKTYGKDINEHPRLPLIQRHNDFVRKTFLAVRHRYFS